MCPNSFNVERVKADDRQEYPHRALTEKIIGCAIQVHRVLGPGYVESVYELALVHELVKQGMRVHRQRVYRVTYDGVEVGEHRVDVLVDETVVLELKNVECLLPIHAAQLISALKAVGAEVGLLINFNEEKLVHGIKRVVLTKT
jgi:GxxExxY protein